MSRTLRKTSSISVLSFWFAVVRRESVSKMMTSKLVRSDTTSVVSPVSSSSTSMTWFFSATYSSEVLMSRETSSSSSSMNDDWQRNHMWASSSFGMSRVSRVRSEEHTSELQSPYVISYAV